MTMAVLKITISIMATLLISCMLIACTNKESKIYGEWSTISKETRISFKKDHTGLVNIFANITSNTKPKTSIDFKWKLVDDGTFKLTDAHNNILIFKVNKDKIETEYNGNILEYSKVYENAK